jgi:hypothetical protein
MIGGDAVDLAGRDACPECIGMINWMYPCPSAVASTR